MARFRWAIATLLTAAALSAATSSDDAMFAKYRVAEAEVGMPSHSRPAAVIDTPAKRLFRTRLRTAMRQPANFAGHLRIISWGCGTGCFQFAVVDLLTGNSYMYPESVTAVVGNRIDYRLNSRALHVVGLLNEADPEDLWYAWDGSSLTLVQQRKLPEECFTSFDAADMLATPRCNNQSR